MFCCTRYWADGATRIQKILHASFTELFVDKFIQLSMYPFQMPFWASFEVEIGVDFGANKSYPIATLAQSENNPLPSEMGRE